MASINTGMRPPGRVFSVTGGASGMGFTTASLLAEHGAKAILDCRSANKAIRHSPCKTFNNQSVDGITTKHRVLHSAANIAGVAKSALRGDRLEPALLHETDAKWRQIYSVNLDGVMYCTRAQFRVMYQKPESNPSIVNVSSMAALIHGGHAYSYGTSNAGAEHFTRNAATDEIQYGIRVNCVLPRQTKTPMLKQCFEGASEEEMKQMLAQIGLSQAIEASGIAQSVVWLLIENSSKMHGISLPVGAGAP